MLGHALYMKAIHGGGNKTDGIDSEKIAMLLRGGNFPVGFVYPNEMRCTRDLLREERISSGDAPKRSPTCNSSAFTVPSWRGARAE